MVAEHLSADFCWSFLYEIPFPTMQLIALAAMGAADRYVAAAKADNPEAALLDLMDKELADDKPLEWDGGADGLFTREDLIALLIALFRSFKSLVLYGAYMSELVQRIKAGSEKDFLDALKVDRTVILCPSVTEYAATWLSKAEMLGRKQAIARFVSAVRQRPPRTLRKHRKLRFMLQYMKESGLLKGGEVSLEAVQFLQQLDVYATAAGADRSLAQFVRRWQRERLVTQDRQFGVADEPKS
jgi:hypothetical protein